jgi:hypothetical protein
MVGGGCREEVGSWRLGDELDEEDCNVCGWLLLATEW